MTLDGDGVVEESIPQNLEGVLDVTQPLWRKQQDPEGERYALTKILQTHEEQLRGVFMFYCQLGSACMKHWPPRLQWESWTIFCRDSEISGPPTILLRFTFIDWFRSKSRGKNTVSSASSDDFSNRNAEGLCEIRHGNARRREIAVLSRISGVSHRVQRETVFPSLSLGITSRSHPSIRSAR